MAFLVLPFLASGWHQTAELPLVMEMLCVCGFGKRGGVTEELH